MSELPLKALIKRLYQYLITYAYDYLQYLGYEVAERVVKSIAYLITNVLVIVLLSLCLNIAFLGLAFALGILTQSLPTTLFVIAGVYFTTGMALLLFRKTLLLRPLQKQLITFLFNDPPS